MRLETLDKQGRTFVLVPKIMFENLVEDAEMLADIESYDLAKSRDEEAFPIALFHAIENGENPIKIFREYRNLTQKKLAKSAGISEAYLSQIEGGVRTGTAKKLQALAKALDVDIELLMP